MHCKLICPFALIFVLLAKGAPTLAGPGHDHPKPAPATAPDPHDDNHNHDQAHTDEVTLSPEAIRKYGITLGIVSKQSIANSVIAPARVAFNTDAMAHVGSSVTGRVIDLRVKLGDAVKKGDTLAVVDSPELGEAQSDLLLKRTNFQTARPAVTLAQDAYDRANQLHNLNQGIAFSEVQRREIELRAAEAALRTAEAAANAAENKLLLLRMSPERVAELITSGKIVPLYHVVAPIDGQVVEREMTLGELVRPDRDALLIIADLSTVWVIADVPEARAGDVGIGSPARLKIAAFKDRLLEGTVTYIAPAIDPKTSAVKARVAVSNPSGVLRPGMFAQAILAPPASSDSADAVLAIPEEAIQTVEGGPAVFVPVDGEPGTFAKRPVTIGKPTAGMVQVLTGLNEGDSFVTTGSFILKADLGKAGAAHEH